MGINSFYKTLSILFGESFVITKDQLNNTRKTDSIKPEDIYDNIYFDFNTLLYKSTHGSRKILNRRKYHHSVMKQGKDTNETDLKLSDGDEEEIPEDTRMVFHSVVLEGVMRYLNHFDARESLFVSVDGPAPRSKLITQKIRRYLNSALTNTGNTFVSFINLSDMDEEIVLTEVQKVYLRLLQKNIINERADKKAISSVWFVPGTNLMQEVSLLIWQLGALILTNPTFSNNLTFYCSPAEREGEGEFKIIEHIYASELTNDKKTEKRDLIISGDSDFVLYALNLPQNRHITLVKDMPSFYQLYDVTKLKEQIANRCKTKSNEDLSRIIRDMTFLFILCGNDYISKLRRFDIKLFMERYISHQKKSQNREYLIDLNLKKPNEMKINVKLLSSLYSDYMKGFKLKDDEDFETYIPRKKADNTPKINIENIPTKEAMIFLMTLLNLGKREFLYEDFEIIEGDSKTQFQIVLRIGESYITTARGNSKKDAFDNAFKNIFLNFDYGELYREAKVKTGIFETRELFNEFLSFFYQEQIEKYANTLRKTQQKIAEVSYQPIVKDYLNMSAWFMSYIHGHNLGYSQYYKPKSIPSLDELVLFCEKEVEGKPDSFLTVTVPDSDNFILNPLEFCVSSCVSSRHKYIVPIQEVKEVFENSPVQHLFDHREDFIHVLSNWLKEDTLKKIRNAISEKLEAVPNKEDYSFYLKHQQTTKMTLNKFPQNHLDSLPAKDLLPNYSFLNPNRPSPLLKNIRIQAEVEKPHKVYQDSSVIRDLLHKRRNIKLTNENQIRTFKTALRLFK